MGGKLLLTGAAQMTSGPTRRHYDGGAMLADDMTLCSAVLMPDPFQAPAEGLGIQIKAATAAGFTGISLWRLHADAAAVGGHSPEAVREMVLAAGLAVPMVEAIEPFEMPDDHVALAAAKPVFGIAEAYGAPNVLAVSMAGPAAPKATGTRLRALCQVAADHGLTVLIEFLPWSAVPDLATAEQVLDAAACDNAGLVFDAWHWQRQPGGPCPDVLRRFPPELIRVFQICDAAPKPDGPPLQECMVKRALPGEGCVDFGELLALFDEIDARPLLAPEVFNARLLERGPHAAAAAIAAATRRVVERADHPLKPDP